MGWSVIALMLLTCISVEDPHVARCTPILEKIIDVQDHRQRELVTFRRDLALYYQHAMHPWEFRAKRDIWLTTENALASEANSLYETADNLDCFDIVDWE